MTWCSVHHRRSQLPFVLRRMLVFIRIPLMANWLSSMLPGRNISVDAPLSLLIFIPLFNILTWQHTAPTRKSHRIPEIWEVLAVPALTQASQDFTPGSGSTILTMQELDIFLCYVSQIKFLFRSDYSCLVLDWMLTNSLYTSSAHLTNTELCSKNKVDMIYHVHRVISYG